MVTFEVQDEGIAVAGTTVSFGQPVAEVLDFEEFVVVRLGLTGEYYPDIKQNVIAVNPNGSIRWKIDKSPDRTGGSHDAYAGIFKDDDNLYAVTLNGMRYHVDLADGSIIDGQFVK